MSGMKRFWLFGGTAGEYAKGGLGDVLGGFNTVEEARAAATQVWQFSDGSGTYTLSWFHIADMEGGHVTDSHGSPCGNFWFKMPTGRIEPQADPF